MVPILRLLWQVFALLVVPVPVMLSVPLVVFWARVSMLVEPSTRLKNELPKRIPTRLSLVTGHFPYLASRILSAGR